MRELKTNKAEKSVVDAEVAVLLDLKKKLASAQGQDAAPSSGGGKKKGGKKQQAAPEVKQEMSGTANAANPAEVERLTASVNEQVKISAL